MEAADSNIISRDRAPSFCDPCKGTGRVVYNANKRKVTGPAKPGTGSFFKSREVIACLDCDGTGRNAG